ncbi:MAG: SLBB domain-containing protein [Deltaproteobacteria bacterium]|nr:SLBB domain-containing protein [Deltaproteobacteria bacterium]
MRLTSEFSLLRRTLFSHWHHKFASIILLSALVALVVAFSMGTSYCWAQSGLGDKADSKKQIARFSGLSPEQKQQIITQLGEEERKEIFRSLTDEEKVQLFRQLNSETKKRVFSILDEDDQKLIFQALNEEEKKRLFATLSTNQKSNLLAKFPSFALVLESEKPPPTQKTKPVAAPKAAGLTPIEKILSGKFPTDISRQLRLYGYDFFNRQVSTFAPVTNVPVGDNYVIGPGDSFTIHLWGKAEKSYEVTVTRDGSIFVPRLGTLDVSGMRFVELKRFLFRRFKEFYPEFEMSITMGRLRTIQVYIVGEATHPGTYSVSSLSTVIPALYVAGGPSKRGSLRNIKVYRAGNVLTTIDLYDFFLSGLRKGDIRLQNQDTIFIPVIGPVVGVAGNVRRPAIYEMKGQESIGDAIKLAGGLLPTGYLQNVVVERVQGHHRRIIKSFNLDPSFKGVNKNLSMPLRDGDVVKIYPVYKGLRKVVYLEGHVKYPREYEFRPGMRLRDLIHSYDDLLPEPYLARAEIIRLMPPDLHPEVVQFNLGALLEGDESQNLLLQELDRVKIYGLSEKEDLPQVSIYGAVRKPGTYRLLEGMTVQDLVFEAGNFTSKAYMEMASISRVKPGQTESDTVKIEFSPRRAMQGLPSDNLKLQPDDVVHIREIPEYTDALGRIITLEGEFVFPGRYRFSKGERLASVIKRAGGLTNEAYPLGAIFQRESVKSVQAEQLREYIRKLEADILSLSSQAAETAVGKEEAAILQQTLVTKKQLLERLRAAEPTGRMVIELDQVLEDPHSRYNFELRPGDRLIVPKRPDYVNVLGEVYNPTALLAEQDKTVGYYLNMVGGMTDNADEDHVYLVKANGAVISKGQEGLLGMTTWDSRTHRWIMGGFESLRLDPGDTIIVPRKVEKYPWLRVTKDITEILYRIAVTAGVIIVAY